MPGAGEFGEGGFNRLGVGDAPGVRSLRPGGLLHKGSGQGGKAPAAAGGGADDRAAEPLRQGGEVCLYPLLFRFVQKIHAQDQAGRDLPNLQHQAQVPGQAGGIGHGHGHIRRPGEKIVPGYFLLRGVGAEGIGAGQVHQAHGGVSDPKAPLRRGNSLSGPVAGVLVQTREGVEHRGFAHIGVSRQGGCDFFHVCSPLPH